ncbi:hypothetical protein PS833_02909 [Pseudomonas fluorescens]|uniref:Uncharacterized protein n=2 Tax=Pseudomonas fluorescens TaxID=294 RepID=A0A5E7D9K7_PSEFL|nr:hypothetical protein PS833_02909 [Pseudomonas fluorescens]
MLQLVQLTDAVMVLSEAVIHDHVRTGLVKVLDGNVIDGLAPYGIILRKGAPRSRELQHFWHCGGQVRVSLRETSRHKATAPNDAQAELDR